MIMQNKLGMHLVSVIALTLTACGSAPKYACKAAVGLGCISVKGVYEKVASGQLNTKKTISKPVQRHKPVEGDSATSEGILVNASAPTYIAPKIMRIWIGPWADKNGVYHSQSYVYKVVSKGRWLDQPGGVNPADAPRVYYSSIHAKKP